MNNGPKLPVTAAPRGETELMGCRVILDAQGGAVAYVVFDEDAEHIALALNLHDELVAALRLAQPALLHSTPVANHYPEPARRHVGALYAVDNVLKKLEQPK